MMVGKNTQWSGGRYAVLETRASRGSIRRAAVRFPSTRVVIMSFLSLSRWRPYQLLGAWVAYWLALLFFAIGPAIPAILRATRKGVKGEINASFGDAVLSLTVKQAGQVTWSGSVHLLTAALWLALPPLVLWVVWLRARGAAMRGDARVPLSS